MPEKSGGSVSTADPPSSNPLLHLSFSTKSDSDFLSPFSQNIESSYGNSFEKVMQALLSSGSSAFTRVEKPDGSLPRRNNQCPDRLADLNSCSNTNSEPEFVSPISALALADNTDGSVSAREYPQGTSVIETQFPVGFNTSLPDSVTLGQKLPELVPLDDDDRTSLRGTADGGNEGMVERQVDEVVGIHVGTQPPRRENVEETRDEETVDLIEHHSICALSESDGDEIQKKSPGTLNAEKRQVNCKLPEIGMMFSSEAAAYEFYKNYATNIGFCVRKGKVRRLSNGKVRKKYFLCTRQGFRLKKQCNKTTKYKRKETRTGCNAMIQFTIENGKWVITELNLQHNHELVSSSQLCKSYRNISDAREIFDSVNEAGMEKDAADTQNEEFHGMDCNNFLPDKKMSVTMESRPLAIPVEDMLLFTKYLESFKVKDPSFFYKKGVVYETGSNIFFWRDWISKKNYDDFGDVLIFDTTFRMDLYDMICVPFVGVNHHRQYILFGCAFLLNETAESFIWLFETFMEAMGGRQPRTIFTDECPALANAIGKVLPETHHRFCMWNICQNATKYLSDSFRRPGFQSHFYKCIFYCQSKENFQSMWDSLLDQYNLHENSWLRSLYMLREKWSHIFSKKSFTASIETVQSGKGINDVFHNLTSRTMTLERFARQYEEELVRRFKKEWCADLLDDDLSTTIVTSSLLEKQAVNIYTHAAFKLFQEKLSESQALEIEEIASGGTIVTYKLTEGGHMKESIVAFSSSDGTITCSCKNIESTGILCVHALKVLNVRNIYEIPAQYILKRWTKYAKKEVVDDRWKETICKRKRSSSLDPSQLMESALYVIAKCGTMKDARIIVEKHLNEALKEVNKHLKRKQYDESSSYHQPAIKIARVERIQSLSTGSSTRISSSQVEGRPPKYTNTCRQTSTSSSSTFHDVEANPIMAVDMLISAPLNVPTRTHYNQRNLEKDEDNPVLVQTNPSLPMPQNDKVKTRACQLALGSIDRVVANGHVHELEGSNPWHGSIFDKHIARVSIDSLEKAEYGSERLPIRTPDAHTLMEAIDGFVVWPRHLIILKNPVVKAPLEQENFAIVVKNFAQLVDRRTKQNPLVAIYVVVDREVFQLGNPSSIPMPSIPVLREDLMNLIKFEKIGATVMQLYMCALFNKVKEMGVDHIVRFVAPAGVNGHNKDYNADLLFHALKNAEQGQFFLYPYNIGLHWVMAIIDPRKRHMLYFDPLGNEVDRNVDDILSNAYKKLDDGKLTPSKTYEKVMCPRQPGSIECGYYVMRYMKDVIDSYGTHPAKVFYNNGCYGRDMIDEVRVELMKFIRDNM